MLSKLCVYHYTHTYYVYVNSILKRSPPLIAYSNINTSYTYSPGIEFISYPGLEKIFTKRWNETHSSVPQTIASTTAVKEFTAEYYRICNET